MNEISNYLCFLDQSHFQKSFKSQYNITPQAYRKSLL
ncbi:AraC family transcriptional regulator [Litchfieldia alkalitelluris]